MISTIANKSSGGCIDATNKKDNSTLSRLLTFLRLIHLLMISLDYYFHEY